ncbi:MAG TPA: ammonium transporter [Halomonas sp.]|jgi:Amt family ammonium transporter|uniref:ammonium transporter n=1 Tax=Halomonadaceae TaxID=28256 RepID=UPI0005CC0718|nr:MULTISPECIES: ammonium transporter [Halomonas]KJD18426.1 ammonium transporter [Halomonas meridiana]MAG53108.1 ammonium transporter [Halomonas sp.]MCO7243973.1 ammonium transporter [Halomonas sp. Ps84H-12]HAV44177.1 ammonium transporter [Halomonas sp.]HBM42716.1 ammonium transporter [Halomonas sp.]|tara:strand:- start:959 stop:2290 length:1332 start_codon:yes stop_codon:yes gene_type:complete
MNEITLELSYALDTFYFLVCTAFVMFMACGFAMLESGLVRSKNTVEILTKNAMLYSVACLVYLVVGYNLMYPANPVSSFIPGLDFMLGSDNSMADISAGEGSPYYSSMADFIFQAVFAAATMSIVSGAIAERMKLWPFLVFAVFMVGVIYPVNGFWKWGGGFLDEMGFQDFAGSVVVHMAGGAAALAAVLMVGARKGRFGPNGEVRAIPGANLPIAMLGMFILWMGWFGFNGGSMLKIASLDDANAVARIFVNTNTAAASGMVAAALLYRALFGKTDMTMVMNGALAGLVSITAEPLLPGPGMAMLVGAIGGVVVVLSVLGLDRLRIDDPVGAISVHGSAGIWGIVAVVFTNPDATLGIQLLGTVIIFAWMFGASLVVLFIIRAVMGLRVSEQDEFEGMDAHECGMHAYPEFVSANTSDMDGTPLRSSAAADGLLASRKPVQR